MSWSGRKDYRAPLAHSCLRYSNEPKRARAHSPFLVREPACAVSAPGSGPTKNLGTQPGFLVGRQTNTADEPILLQVYEALLNHQNFKEKLTSLNLLIETLAIPNHVTDKQFLI